MVKFITLMKNFLDFSGFFWDCLWLCSQIFGASTKHPQGPLVLPDPLGVLDGWPGFWGVLGAALF